MKYFRSYTTILFSLISYSVMANESDDLSIKSAYEELLAYLESNNFSEYNIEKLKIAISNVCKINTEEGEKGGEELNESETIIIKELVDNASLQLNPNDETDNNAENTKISTDNVPQESLQQDQSPLNESESNMPNDEYDSDTYYLNNDDSDNSDDNPDNDDDSDNMEYPEDGNALNDDIEQGSISFQESNTNLDISSNIPNVLDHSNGYSRDYANLNSNNNFSDNVSNNIRHNVRNDYQDEDEIDDDEDNDNEDNIPYTRNIQRQPAHKRNISRKVNNYNVDNDNDTSDNVLDDNDNDNENEYEDEDREDNSFNDSNSPKRRVIPSRRNINPVRTRTNKQQFSDPEEPDDNEDSYSDSPQNEEQENNFNDRKLNENNNISHQNSKTQSNDDDNQAITNDNYFNTNNPGNVEDNKPVSTSEQTEKGYSKSTDSNIQVEQTNSDKNTEHRNEQPNRTRTISHKEKKTNTPPKKAKKSVQYQQCCYPCYYQCPYIYPACVPACIPCEYIYSPCVNPCSYYQGQSNSQKVDDLWILS